MSQGPLSTIKGSNGRHRKPPPPKKKVEEWRSTLEDKENVPPNDAGAVRSSRRGHGAKAKKAVTTTSSLNPRANDFSDYSARRPPASGALFVTPFPSLSSLAAALTTEAAEALPSWMNPDTLENVVEYTEMKAVVEERGYIAFRLRDGIQVNVGPNFAVQVINRRKHIRLALSGCATQTALVHPQGRILQYNSRIEVHAREAGSNMEKNAKIWPRGISFTSNNCAIVYLVDQAGTRSTSDFFHNLYFEDITETIFHKSCEIYNMANESFTEYGAGAAFDRCIGMLEEVEYYQSERADVWRINDTCIIQQTFDGYVSVERKYGNELFSIKTSPTNGKARLESSFIYVTASHGTEAHLFVKSKDRRIHLGDKAFVVRNAGHSAGFDEKSNLRIF